MKRFRLYSLSVTALLALLFAGCAVEDPEVATIDPLAGSQFFADYVAIGNSLTAGFMDGGLHINGQLTSYPALVAQQLALVGTDKDVAPFYQPLISHPGIGSTDTGNPATVAGVLYWDGASPTVSDIYDAVNVPMMLLAATVPVPYSNLGIPGAILWDTSNATSAATSNAGDNSFFDIILRNPNFGNTTQLQQGIGSKPTLVTVWIGNNDVLDGAMSGTPEVGVNVTPAADFETMYTDLIVNLAGGVTGQTGFAPLVVAANIPSVTSIPFFIPAALFSGLYPFGYVEDDVSLVTFPAMSWIQVPENQGLPVPATYTLTADEVTTVETATDAYNSSIADICNANGVALVDAHTIMAGLSAPEATHFVFLVQGGMDVATAAATTLFSLDGIHPNNRGYGVVANAFIDVINQTAGTSLAQVNVGALAWDPTYGIAATAIAAEGMMLTPEAARAMGAIFRR